MAEIDQGHFFFETNDSVIFGGDGRDIVYFRENSDNGLFFGGNGKDTVFFDAIEVSPQNSYSWGGGDSDQFTTFINTTDENKIWIIDFNFSPTDEGGDRIEFFEYKSEFSHAWAREKTQLVPHTADDNHLFLSEGAQYYELKVQSSVNSNDSNWYSVLNLVGTDLTVKGLFDNGNLIHYI